MKLSATVISAILSASALSIGADGSPIMTGTASDVEAQGYNIVPLTFTGPVTPDGKTITLTGTAEDIYAQILKLNPSYNATDFEDDNDSSLEKRKPVGDILCNLGYSKARTDATRDGIAYLGKMKGYCGVGAGPRICSRLACSWNSAIYMCNDNKSPVHTTCANVANYAQAIFDKCASSALFKFNGQRFDSDNYNILVAGYDKC